MAVLFFTHLQHSRTHADAAKRLAAAKAAQQEARRRIAYGQLKAVQARIDPQFLFDMLEAVRRAYETDPERAERLLDELGPVNTSAAHQRRARS
jgi:LytS/YehU family sensor histidine kinase